MKNEKKQTAVEWLFDRLQNEPFLTHEDFEQAKEMDTQIIVTAYDKGTVNGIDYPESTLPLTGEQYYKQTYGGNK